ncbi:pilus assembly FimT family protein [Lacticaseibacillus yichunensis]|uniref:Tfp pilus assembly protein FimT/FimU n=1 Tax=Lacticaseibacillus yichunensis TaxID=2486015 RepID=A0ABW4CLC2_9LACO|nr:prepilin-type N-terminal cleavage/methylation domain-containing protein [Lacticaseibacillus yichunensis]
MRRRGFTLIEVVASLVVATLLLTVALAGARQLIAQQSAQHFMQAWQASWRAQRLATARTGQRARLVASYYEQWVRVGPWPAKMSVSKWETAGTTQTFVLPKGVSLRWPKAKNVIFPADAEMVYQGGDSFSGLVTLIFDFADGHSESVSSQMSWGELRWYRD